MSKKKFNPTPISDIGTKLKMPSKRILPFLDNEFVSDFEGDKFIYTKDFDIALYKKIHDEGMTYVEAYNALGFDTKVLGEDRANAAGKRVMKKAEENKLFVNGVN